MCVHAARTLVPSLNEQQMPEGQTFLNYLLQAQWFVTVAGNDGAVGQSQKCLCSRVLIYASSSEGTHRSAIRKTVAERADSSPSESLIRDSSETLTPGNFIFPFFGSI